MASRKKRSKTILPQQQAGQQLISRYFSPKNVSEVRGKENARESSSGESSQTQTASKASVVAVATIEKPTSASGTRKNNGVSSRKNSSKQAKKQPECLDRFSQLPEEILQNIFCQLPIADLRSCALVCPQWRSVISNDLFIPWKKKYFHHKNGDGSSQEEMMKLLNEKGLLELDSFPINLASFMKDYRSNRHLSALEQQYLERHHNFSCIEQFLQTPTCESKEGTSLWSVVALLIWSSQTDYEVHRLMNYMSRCTPCLVYDILEFLYCLASIFCCLESRDLTDTSTRLYYRVLCSLYLYENACLPKCASENDSAATRKQSQSRTQGPQLPVTYEQARIVIQEVKSEELMKIVAFAGTGKTTTLVEYTRKRPKKKFLNVAYNKSIQQHAVKTFPSNVESRTIHSLAYKSVGKLYQHKLTFNLRINCIMDALQGDFGYLHARRVSDTLNNFIASADATVKLEHVPEVNREVVENLLSEDSSDDTRAILGNQDPNTEFLNSTKCKKRVVSHAEGLWERMKNKTDNDLKITHDGYLKIYQLSKPILEGYDYILVDEAQDCTPAASDILLRQSCAKILVGDPHQQIYAFRGARNALQEVEGTHTFYLTQSFRFGPGIANVASRLLNNLKGVQDKRLVGVAKTGTGQDENFEQQCVITRCNSTLFDEAANVCCQNNNTKVGFVGGKKGLALDRVLDIHKLYNNAPSSDIKDPFIKKFNSFAELKKYAKAAPDIEMLSKIKIVETHQGSLEHKIEMIKSKAVENYKKGDVIYTTAHKAKGLEFDKVRLTDDFLPGIRKGEDEEREDEKNLAYVAVTRAKKRLELSDTIQKIVTRTSIINQNRDGSLETSS